MKLSVFTLFLFLTLPVQLLAGVVLNETRVIYLSDKQEITVRMKNTGPQAALIQSWLDTGDPLEHPGKSNVPFVVMPPVTRIDSGKGQTLRIMYIDATLPDDRESVLWLNVLAVPPKVKDVNHQYLNAAYQTRIKLFYRPVNLNVKPETSAQKLQWEKEVNGLTVFNPTPYYISLLSVDWLSADKTVSLQGEMVAPYGKVFLKTKDNIKGINTLRYTVIDDSGRAQSFSASVTR